MSDARPLAVLVVSPGPADARERTLAGVRTWLPDARVLVWDPADGAPGPVAATNRLMDRVPDHDVLVLDPGTEVLGPLARARAALAEPGVAVVAPTVLDATGRDRPWDVARRGQGVVRDLLHAAGYAERLRGRRAGDLYAAAPDDVDGHLTGPALLISRAARDALGPFDEHFYADGAAEVWQRAARAAGWSLRLVDDGDGGAPQVRRAGAAAAGDPLAPRRDDDVARSGRVLALGLEHNAGRGSLFAAGSTVLERTQRSRRRPRRARLEALAARAGDVPAVVVVTNGLRPGGAERQRVVLANELVARGHPVTMVCLQHLGQYLGELDPRVRLLLQPWWQPVVDVAPTREALVVGGCTRTEIGFALGWRALGPAAGQRRRWLPAAHDPARTERPTYSEAQARALRTADGMLVLSRRHHEDLTRRQRLADTVMVAPNGLAPGAPLPPRPTTGPVRFVMLTRLREYKNTTLLVEALDALARPGEWTLDVFGDGPDRAALEARVPRYLRGQVHWHGASPGPDHAFADADVLCVPSGFEAFPLVMVEAMTRGLPVMASASGSVPEMLGHGAAGIVVDPVTVPAWSKALGEVLDDRARLVALGAAGRERALARYTDHAMVDAYVRAFVRVLGHSFEGAQGPADTL